MYNVVDEAAKTVTQLEEQLAKARATLAAKEALTPTQRLAEAMHEHLCFAKPHCEWRAEFAYNERPEGYLAYEHTLFEEKATKVLALVGNLEDALTVLKVMTTQYDHFN